MTQIVERTETELPINLTVSQTGVGGVTGLSAFYSVRDAATLDSFLDFADGLFKTAGHTTLELPLSEVGLGRYTRVGGLDLSAITLPAGTRSLELHFRTSGSLVAVANDTVHLVNSFLNIPSRVWDELRAGHNLAGTFGEGVRVSEILTAALDAIADQVWDEQETGHLAPGTMARAVTARAVETTVVAGGDATSIRTTRTEADDFWTNMQITIISGGLAVTRNIDSYTNLNGTFVLSAALPFTPAGGETVIVHRRIGRITADPSTAIKATPTDPT